MNKNQELNEQSEVCLQPSEGSFASLCWSIRLMREPEETDTWQLQKPHSRSGN